MQKDNVEQKRQRSLVYFRVATHPGNPGNVLGFCLSWKCPER